MSATPYGAWVRACALAETIGMTAASSAAVLADRLATVAALAVVVAGGLVEGTALGWAQSRVLARIAPALSRSRYVAATVLVAGVGWALASAPAALAEDDGAAGDQPPLLLVLLGAAGLGLVMGAVLGAAQAAALRGALARPGRWVTANAVAWPPAMAVIFLGATAPSAAWSAGAIIATGVLTGLAAGVVLGLVSGRFLPALRAGRCEIGAG